MSDNESYNLEISPNESFDLTNEQETEHFQVGFDDSEDMELGFGDIHRFNEADFNKLYNRPSYDGETMTGDTNIPKVVTYQAGDNIEIENDTISVVVDPELSDSSEHPVQNAVVTTAINTKANTSDLATVAFTGEYSDLENEPRDFTEEEWSTLWADY